MATYKKELARELDQKIDYVVVDNYEKVLFQTDNIEKARLAIQDTDDINPDNDIIGVKNYSLGTLDLSNGMKISFTTSKVSTDYQNKEYYVEGVGDSITLTDARELITPGDYSEEFTVGFDDHVYDSIPFAKALKLLPSSLI